MEHVRKVKRAENGMIYEPVTILKDACVGDALSLMKENRIGGIPVIDERKRLIGIVTNRDLRFIDNMKTPICEDHDQRQSITTVRDRSATGHCYSQKVIKLKSCPLLTKKEC